MYLSHEDLSYNYATFALSILSNVTPEMAFEAIEVGFVAKGPGRKKYCKFITNADIEDMIKLKAEGETWKDIGEMYGLSESGAWRRVKRYKEECEMQLVSSANISL